MSFSTITIVVPTESAAAVSRAAADAGAVFTADEPGVADRAVELGAVEALWPDDAHYSVVARVSGFDYTNVGELIRTVTVEGEQPVRFVRVDVEETERVTPSITWLEYEVVAGGAGTERELEAALNLTAAQSGRSITFAVRAQ